MRVVKFTDAFIEDQEDIFSHIANKFGIIYVDNFLIVYSKTNIFNLLLTNPTSLQTSVRELYKTLSKRDKITFKGVYKVISQTIKPAKQVTDFMR